MVVHADAIEGPREVARHQLTTPGRPSIDDAYYPPRPPRALERRPRARSAKEQAFLRIGPAAEAWLVKAAAAGTRRLRRKMAEAADLSKVHGADEGNRALETCAHTGRFADRDLASVLAHQARTGGGELVLFPAREESSLQNSTRA